MTGIRDPPFSHVGQLSQSVVAGGGAEVQAERIGSEDRPPDVVTDRVLIPEGVQGLEGVVVGFVVVLVSGGEPASSRHQVVVGEGGYAAIEHELKGASGRDEVVVLISKLESNHGRTIRTVVERESESDLVALFGQ